MFNGEEIKILENLGFQVNKTKNEASILENEGTLWVKKHSLSIVGEIENYENEILVKRESSTLKGLLVQFGWSSDGF